MGLIDSDYVGQVQAMVSVSEPSVVFQKGTCIAQFVPFMSCVPIVVDWSRGTGGFGSTGPPQVLWTQKVTDECLVIQCLVTAKGCHPGTTTLSGLLDRGADVTIISQLVWSPTWPLTQSTFGIVGLGGLTTGALSAIMITVTHPKGQQANIRPCVTNAQPNLWGHDCLTQWGVEITMDF